MSDEKPFFVTGRVLFIISQLSLTALASETCDIRERDGCRYTIYCDRYAGSAYNPECNYDIYVTFVIANSVVESSLTAGFFGSTNFDSRVREIKAIGNTWPNIESYAFRYYPKTIVMDLSNNGIVRIRSEAFKNLIALNSLNISHNSIESFNSKTFLISENRIANMEILDLSYNNIIELIDESFNFLTNLKTLYLQNNKITNLANSLSDLKNLEYLNLSYNEITALNTTMVQLKKLKVLDISFNKLTQLSGYETNQLISLETVNMSYNSIETIESNCFNQAFNLLELDLSYNRIKSNIDSLIFINNNKLKYLDLFGNNITHIQDNAFKHNKLQYLNLEKNYLSGEITSNTFSGLNNVTLLNLSNQNITAIRKYAFLDSDNLSSLNLSQNNIQFIENSSFPTSTSLKVLDVSHNNLSDVNYFNNSLENLIELYLDHNNLIKIPKNTFKNQTKITKLDLSDNKIENIEPNSLPLNVLQYLNVRGNALLGTIKMNMFSPANLLRFLDLSNFKFNKIEQMSLIDMPVLARLNISHNELEYIDPNNFMRMDNMYSLDLSYNKLLCFHLNNSSLINLKALYLNNNNLSNISRTLINMTGLLYVDLSNNNISDLSDVPFASLQNLKVLHLSHNNIRVFNNPAINSLVKLTDLSLSGNQLTEINLSHFRDLGMVDISHNKLSVIDPKIFENLDYLQSLDISANNITVINPGTFQTAKILKILNLAHNKISNLRYGVFRGLNRTEVLDLSYNNFSAIDVLVFHECYELKILTVDYNYLKSFDVERLVITVPKLSKLSIGGNPLSCKEIVRNIKNVNKNLIRQIEVTSIDKIFHEDNVHGIKCGDTNATATSVQPEIKPTELATSTSLGLIIWCAVLTVIVLIIVVGFYWYNSKKNEDSYAMQSRLQLRNSMSGFSEASTNKSLLD